MSLLNTVDEALRLTRVEEAKINESIRQLRAILLSMKAEPKEAPEEQVPSTDNEEGVLPEEREEMELLERVLRRALRVRCRSGALRGPETAGRGDEGVLGSNQAESDGSASRTASKPACKPSAGRTASRRSASASGPSEEARGGSGHRAGRGRGGTARISARNRTVAPGRAALPRRPGTGWQSAPAPAPGEHRHPQASLAGAQQRATQTGLCSEDSDMRQDSAEDLMPVMCLAGTDAGGRSLSTTKGVGKPSVPPSVWRAHRTKHERLWDKVLATASKPVEEKARFTERLLSTFPCKVPTCSPADTRAEVERLTQLCRALTHCLHGEALAHRTGRQPGTGACWELEYESLLMQEGLEKVVLDLQGRVEKLKRDAEAWDRWGPGYCCPTRGRGRWGAPDLPRTLRYASEAQLAELEGLRLRVAQLQQEIHLHQAMREAMTPCLTSAWSARGGPGASVLRGLYSLLGEGGARFPAVVLDTEPD
ncbi:tubulin epsilon and delta complex protein 2 isoform X2 [Anguilla anguilla]|uniref:tubulin epsilon and delta complex protein 2 isoform X2 n=1 Tax=Anguilla anguilla TaxID=7936 RepID=UPI0015AA6E6B|nr:tubulin epsilon and delta complex protein 2 isoform X2 [Anguilla anguilla]